MTEHTEAVDRKAGFSRGPKPFHFPIRPANRAEKLMTWPLHHPLPLAPKLDWRARGRSRIWIGGAHPHLTARGEFRPELAASAGLCWPARSSNMPVGRKNDIARTTGAVDAPTYRIRASRCKIRIRMGGRRRSEKRRGAKGCRQRHGGLRRRFQRPHENH